MELNECRMLWEEFKDVLLSIQVITKNGEVLTIPSNKINFEYRNNDHLRFDSLCNFKGIKNNPDLIKKMKKMKIKKEEAQPSKINQVAVPLKIQYQKQKSLQLIKSPLI